MNPVTVRQAAILVGGLGSRLGAATAATPKPILSVGDRPFLAWLVRELVRFGVTDILLLTGYLSPVLEAALPAILASLPVEVRIAVSEEPVRAGTGGALHHAAAHLQDRFLLCNGDSILDFNLARVLADAAAKPGPRIVLRQVADTDRYGVVTVDGDRVTAFRPKAEAPGPGLVNAGIYLLDRSITPHLTPACSLEADVLPVLAASGTLHATLADGFFIDIGIPADLARAQTAIPARFHRPALFLDRDGTINRDHGWVGTRDRWEWLDGALDSIRLATERGWHVFVVTNPVRHRPRLLRRGGVGRVARLDDGGRSAATVAPSTTSASAPTTRRRPSSATARPTPGASRSLGCCWT